MKLVSLNTGLPREIELNGQVIRTSIWKSPQDGRRRVVPHNIDGDRQSDLTVHGGETKAVYCYPSEHYQYWRHELPRAELPWGVFGENLTTEGMLETDVRIGDRFRVGTTQFRVTQPRQPCFKLGIRFGREDMVKRFMASRRSGFYVAIVDEGDVGRGDAVAFTSRARRSLSVAAVFDLLADHHGKGELLKRAADLPELSDGWREHFRKLLQDL